MGLSGSNVDQPLLGMAQVPKIARVLMGGDDHVLHVSDKELESVPPEMFGTERNSPFVDFRKMAAQQETHLVVVSVSFSFRRNLEVLRIDPQKRLTSITSTTPDRSFDDFESDTIGPDFHEFSIETWTVEDGLSRK